MADRSGGTELAKKRRYQKTHPWITFAAGLHDAPPTFWMRLGDARAKCEQVAGIPLPPKVAADLDAMYLAKGVLGTTAIEGNTLTEDQVKRLLAGELELPESKKYLAQEVENIVSACNYIIEHALAHRGTVSPDLIRRFNALVLKDLDLPEEVAAGELRAHSVTVARYLGPPHEDCPYLVQRLCDWINSRDFELTDHGLAGPILKAIIAHLYIAWIHPFGDGNGRTARLIEYYLMTSAGVPLPAAHLLSNHYNSTKTEYLRQLHKASRSGGKIVPFVDYALAGFVDGLDEQLLTIRAHQTMVAWRDMTREHFNSASVVAARRHQLLMAISWQPKPVPINEITELTTGLAAAYAKKTRRTLARDISHLERNGWVELSGDGVRARTEILRAFVPELLPPRDDQMELDLRQGAGAMVGENG